MIITSLHLTIPPWLPIPLLLEQHRSEFEGTIICYWKENQLLATNGKYSWEISDFHWFHEASDLLADHHLIKKDKYILDLSDSLFGLEFDTINLTLRLVDLSSMININHRAKINKNDQMQLAVLAGSITDKSIDEAIQSLDINSIFDDSQADNISSNGSTSFEFIRWLESELSRGN